MACLLSPQSIPGKVVYSDSTHSLSQYSGADTFVDIIYYIDLYGLLCILGASADTRALAKEKDRNGGSHDITSLN